MVLTNHPCSNVDDLHEYLRELDRVSALKNKENDHVGIKSDWTYPCLVISAINLRDPKRNEMVHTHIKQISLLKVLGLTQEEIKFEFGQMSTEQTPEVVENREV